jgi:hypothetical protein
LIIPAKTTEIGNTFISCATTVSRADPALNALARAICNAKIYIDILG